MSLRGLLVAAVGAAMLAPAAHATGVAKPPVEWVRGEGSYTKASRGPRSIDRLVIHVTEGGFQGSVHVLTGARSHASAHYVVARNGKIAQLVHDSDIAWHAGDWKTNVRSIGIEHVGMTYDSRGFPRIEYEASAKLAAFLARRSVMPIDRAHLIGHHEVPDPNNRDARGGADHHTDPGPYWNWRLYLRLVRKYAFPVPPLRVRSTTLSRAETVAGIVPWRAAAKGQKPRRVDFLIDGRVVWRDHRAPFAFAGGRGWNTTGAPNGWHTLELRAIGRGGRIARWRFGVRVRNNAFLVTTAGLRDWQKVKGKLVVRANALGAPTTGLLLYVNGKVKSRDRSKPYRLVWNSRTVADGRHTVVVAAGSVDRRVAKRRVNVVVQNAVIAKPKPKPKPVPKPKPKPKPQPKPAPPAVVSQTLAEGQTVEGAVTWQATTSGPVAQVAFVVDGGVRGTATGAPWTFVWDTAAEVPGTHVVAVRAVAADGRSAEARVTVIVRAPEPPPPPSPPPVAPS